MWFLFGFVTILLFFILSMWMRAKARWKGSTEKTGGYTYLRNLGIYKGKVRSYFVGVEAPDHLSFVFKRESWLDRLCKGIGLSSEQQVGRSKFDDAIYIVSDDEILCRKLITDASIQSGILEIFDAATEACVAKAIRCHGGRLWIDYRVSGDAEHFYPALIEASIVPLLHKIASPLSAVGKKAGSRWNDPFTLKAIAILSVSTGLAINFGVQIIRIHFGAEVPFTVDSTALWKMAALAGIVGAVLFFLAVTLFLGGSARAHLVLIEVLLVGTVGAVGSTYVELRDLNMEWDGGTGVRHEARVIDKGIQRGRRSTSYYLVVQDWRIGNGRYKLEISKAGYDRVLRNEILSVHEMPGYLQVSWISKLSRADGFVLK